MHNREKGRDELSPGPLLGIGTEEIVTKFGNDLIRSEAGHPDDEFADHTYCFSSYLKVCTYSRVCIFYYRLLSPTSAYDAIEADSYAKNSQLAITTEASRPNRRTPLRAALRNLEAIPSVLHAEDIQDLIDRVSLDPDRTLKMAPWHLATLDV